MEEGTFPCVEYASVCGVAIPGTEGRCGMAALVLQYEIDLPAFRQHLISLLPVYARPVILRIRDDIEVLATFKYSKTDLVRQGYAPFRHE
jgi:hypothetical protein